MLSNEQCVCVRKPSDHDTVNYNNVNNSENVLIHNIIRAVIYKVCPDPACRQQCVTAPTVSHNTVITAGITAWGCDLHACSAVAMCAFAKILKLPLRGLQHSSFIPLWPTCRTRQWHNPECCKTTKQQNLWKHTLSATDVLKEGTTAACSGWARGSSSSASSELR